MAASSWRCSMPMKPVLGLDPRDDYGFQPIHIYDAASGKPILSLLRPSKRPSGAEAARILRHVIRRIRDNWPRVEILDCPSTSGPDARVHHWQHMGLAA